MRAAGPSGVPSFCNNAVTRLGVQRRVAAPAVATCEAHFDAIAPLDPQVWREQGDSRTVGQRFREFHIYPGGAGPVVRRRFPIDIDTEILLYENALDDTLVDAAIQFVGARVALHQDDDCGRRKDTDEGLHAAARSKDRSGSRSIGAEPLLDRGGRRAEVACELGNAFCDQRRDLIALRNSVGFEGSGVSKAHLNQIARLDPEPRWQLRGDKGLSVRQWMWEGYVGTRRLADGVAGQLSLNEYTVVCFDVNAFHLPGL